MCDSNDAGQVEGRLAREPTRDWRAVLHQLNNVFASIHSSLDLAMANPGRPEALTFVAQAQESARRGALLVNDLRFYGHEAGEEESKPAPVQYQKGAGMEIASGVSPDSLEGSERILLVDDDEPVRLLIRAVLTYRGYEVTEACDGEEAVKRYQEAGPFDLLILDLHMPKLSGKAALDRIREIDSKVRALALSGSVYEGGPDSSQDQPGAFDARLNKPFDNTELVALVRQLLNRGKSV